MTMLRVLGSMTLAVLMAASPRFTQQAGAQQAGAADPSLEDVLARVADNFNFYKQSIPNVFAEEQLTTDRTGTAGNGSMPRAHKTSANAGFSLQLSPDGKWMVAFGT